MAHQHPGGASPGHDDHGHASQRRHAHAHAEDAGERQIGIAALLTRGFMLAEVVGGLVSGSLALIADAGHMLTDFASLSLAWYGFRLARRPADWRRTYGYDRFSVLAAFTNGIALFAIAAWIVVEAWHRLGSDTEVLGGVMLWVALAGLVVNIIAFRILHGSNDVSLNVRAAALHVTGDLLGSLAALLAAVVIILTGWTPIDPILSVLVALIILRSAWTIVAESGHILLEGAPEGIDSRAVAADLMAAVPGVHDVHHVHAWSISESRPMMTLHARIAETAPPEQTVAALKRRLHDRFGISHATIEIEREGCADEHLPP
ncbi:MAG: cation diffusion facilitator family transporter [Hyphomicrobiaceae bacterium]|nr:cation diffusion facilitator family transporter [Hyphomicrobiaceae bacterium]